MMQKITMPLMQSGKSTNFLEQLANAWAFSTCLRLADILLICEKTSKSQQDFFKGS